MATVEIEEGTKVRVKKDWEKPVVIKAAPGTFLYETKVPAEAEAIGEKMGIWGHSYTHHSGRFIDRWVITIPDSRKEELNKILGKTEEAEQPEEAKRRGRPPTK